MRKNTTSTFDTKIVPRMLSEIQVRAYTGLGRNSVRKLGEEIGAIKKYGRRILYDRKVIDEFFDNGGEFNAED